MKTFDFDIIVVGGGHAGVEAVRIASRMNMTVGLVTMDRSKLGLMSCNPAVGGLGKGQLVKEVDALGGIIGKAADFAGIQFRRLNLSKGPAVRSTRIQCDRRLYCRFVSEFVASLPGVELIEDEAISLIIRSKAIKGIKLKRQGDLMARAVILTTGTFLGGLIHIGKTQVSSGRQGEPAAIELSKSLRACGFELGRLKTGTPPRIDGNSIDYDKTEPQPGDDPPPLFSHFHFGKKLPKNVNLCYLTHTTEETAKLIRQNLDRAPLFSGQISGIGPRYCPSIEDKIFRFADKPRHQLFIEPEGAGTDEIYLNGFSTSLPEDIQQKAVKTIVGLEKAIINKPGYAIEYDFVPPYQIKNSLETKNISGLFHAGQINGTSGYEEAAAQGLVSGLNASLFILNEEPFIPARYESYIGVMIDDLVTRNISEPYRMFTSRAEYRLALREDNALDRLAEYGRKYNIYNEAELDVIDNQNCELESMISFMREKKYKTEYLRKRFGLQSKKGSISLAELVCRPDFRFEEMISLSDNGLEGKKDILDKAIILLKYKGYLQRQDREIEKNRKNEGLKIPRSFDYESISGIKKEAAEKLMRFRPETLGQAGRIEGVTPSDVAVLSIYLKKFAPRISTASNVDRERS